MELDILYGSGMHANTYLLTDSGESALIVCSADPAKVTALLEKRSSVLRYILLTHGHFDHITYLDEMRDLTGAAAMIHKDDAEMLGDSVKNGYSTMYRSGELTVRSAEKELSDGEKITLGGVGITLIHTPGHTKGSSCYLADGVLFSGDTLFCQNVGRTDMYGGSPSALFESLKRLGELDRATVVRPGHGAGTTIGDEFDSNYYMMQAQGDAGSIFD